MSFGKILTEAGCRPQSWPHALKSSLLTNGAEASAAQPWTAPLLSHCRLPEGAQCWGGFSQERLCPWEGLGFTRAAVSQHACHLDSSTDLREASHSCLLEYSEGPGLRNPRSLLIDLPNLQALSFSLMNSKDFFPPKKNRNTTHIFLYLIFHLFGFSTRIKDSRLTSSESNNV